MRSNRSLRSYTYACTYIHIHLLREADTAKGAPEGLAGGELSRARADARLLVHQRDYMGITYLRTPVARSEPEPRVGQRPRGRQEREVEVRTIAVTLLSALRDYHC